MTPQTKYLETQAGKILVQLCSCGTWFPKSRKDRNHCSNGCAVKACQQNDRKLLKKAKKLT